MHLASIKRYHREWWAATAANPPADHLKPPELVNAFSAVDVDLATKPDGRSRAEGPIANVIRAAHAVGWTFLNANTISTGEGTFSLVNTSPGAIMRRFRIDYQRHLDVAATKRIMGDDLGKDHHGRDRILHIAPLQGGTQPAPPSRRIRQGPHVAPPRDGHRLDTCPYCFHLRAVHGGMPAMRL